MKATLLTTALLLGFNSSIALSDEDDTVPITVTLTAQVHSEKVRLESITKTLSVFGDIQPDTDQITTLSLPHAGLISQVSVQLGQQVKQGDVLFTVNTAPTARMTYLQAQAAVAFAHKDLNRERQLLRSHMSTNAQVSIAESKLQDAKINLNSLKKQGLDQNQQVFRAPKDGIIVQLDLKAGQRVQADTSAVQLASQQHWVIHLGIEPEDLSQITLGHAVKLQSVFNDQLVFTSHISQINAILNPATKRVDVIASIPSELTQSLVLGSRLKGEIQLNTHSGITVPRSAILYDEQGAFVYQNIQNKAIKTRVMTGESDHNFVEVIHGLQKSDHVITQGNYELEEGMAIQESQP
ncbi:efflux RND transporter periplasmic adaptor subunit [Thiomicrorhabdus arctica]|jgi:RND family efflux transporter MFP subunit|uniref:efflux RND transporter periplasmic adaptor subunit n=1 Tax=Thiomicrorhabdus arctica TaxID=131540 RepID=UPI0003663D2B|nr:efflux RND transporter periplasmic adaptor subunit [Thiomicrorhabdus arctica]